MPASGTLLLRGVGLGSGPPRSGRVIWKSLGGAEPPRPTREVSTVPPPRRRQKRDRRALEVKGAAPSCPDAGCCPHGGGAGPEVPGEGPGPAPPPTCGSAQPRASRGTDPGLEGATQPPRLPAEQRGRTGALPPATRAAGGQTHLRRQGEARACVRMRVCARAGVRAHVCVRAHACCVGVRARGCGCACACCVRVRGEDGNEKGPSPAPSRRPASRGRRAPSCRHAAGLAVARQHPPSVRSVSVLAVTAPGIQGPGLTSSG